MKKKTLYQCEICHTNYDDKAECEKCEKSLAIATVLIGMRLAAVLHIGLWMLEVI